MKQSVCCIEFLASLVNATSQIEQVAGHYSRVPVHSVISNCCKSFVFCTNVKVRVYRTILVRVSSSQIKKIKMAAKIQDGRNLHLACNLHKSFLALASGMVLASRTSGTHRVC